MVIIISSLENDGMNADRSFKLIFHIKVDATGPGLGIPVMHYLPLAPEPGCQVTS